MKAYGKLEAPDFFTGNIRIGQLNYAAGKSLDILKQIEEQLFRLAGEDEYGNRHLWMAVPRGDVSRRHTEEEWKKCEWFDKEGISVGYEEWCEMLYPMETYWFLIEYAGNQDLDCHGINIRDGRDYFFAVQQTNKKIYSRKDVTHFLADLLVGVKELVDDICNDPAGYNAFVESHLPAQYRYGRIARKDLDRILPAYKLDIKEPELAKTVLRKIIAREFKPKKNFTIREYLRYFHIAVLAFYDAIPENVTDLTEYNFGDDVNFYICQHGQRFEGLDLDDPGDLEKIVYDHYGEIDLTRLNIHTVGNRQEGIFIRVDCTYASMIDKAVNVAVALYKAGAPLDMSWAEMMLAAVEGDDEVRIRPNTCHDYLGGACEGCGGTVEIPFLHECDGTDWSEDSLSEFIRLAKWDKLDPVKPATEATEENLLNN